MTISKEHHSAHELLSSLWFSYTNQLYKGVIHVLLINSWHKGVICSMKTKYIHSEYGTKNDELNYEKGGSFA